MRFLSSMVAFPRKHFEKMWSKMWHHQHFDYQLLIWFTLGFFLVLGGWLRLNHAESRMWWGDSGRDVMVAKMAVERKEVITAGPLAAGGEGFLQNSPFYYYLLAVLWWFTRSPVSMAMIIGVMGTLCILINYLTGKEVGGPKYGITTGLLAAAFTAFSHLMVLYSRSVFQPYTMMLFLALTFLGCIKSIRYPTWFWLSVSTLSFFIALHLHLSALILAPILLLVLAINWYRSWATTLGWKKWIWPVLTLLLIGSWYWATHLSHVSTLEKDGLYTYVLKKLVYLLLPNPKTHLYEWKDPFQFGSYLLWNLPPWWKYILSACVLGGGWGVIAWQWVHKQLNGQLIVLMSLLSTVLLTVSLSSVVYNTYFSPYYFLIFLVAAYVIAFTTHRHHWLGALVAGSFLIGLNHNNAVFTQEAKAREFEVTRIAAQAIWLDYTTQAQAFPNLFPSSNEVPALLISEKTQTMPTYDWVNSSYWYFLEEQAGQPLVRFHNVGSNVTPIVEKPILYYLICRDYDPERGESLVLKSCIKLAFANKEVSKGQVDRNYEKILELTPIGNLRVYRFWRRDSATQP